MLKPICSKLIFKRLLLKLATYVYTPSTINVMNRLMVAPWRSVISNF